MSEQKRTAINPTRKENYSEWYQEVVRSAELADHSPVRGCMVIKPWGYAIWENMQRILDKMFKATNHQNAYFPLFIPLSFLEKEAEHVEGFAKECAVVTHHKLEKNGEGKLVPAGLLEEPLIVRPTSETIIGAMYAKWVESYRDLPILINQWANVVRWEMRTRMFLRTTEFLWQEGHTAHATCQEAEEETIQMLNIYEEFAKKYLAIPVIKGEKTASERFPGAVATYTIEAMMQDGKALQCGTSHFLGQNFAKASGIKFNSKEGKEEYAWTTSWGMTTRLIGALVMTHSDDDGLILPPRIASAHIVIIPIIHKEETKDEVLAFCNQIAKQLQEISYEGHPLSVIIDKKEMGGGEKNWAWIKRGVPIRLQIGPKDLAQDSVLIQRRDQPQSLKTIQKRAEFLENVVDLLEEIQEHLYAKAVKFRDEHIKKIDTKEEFYTFFRSKNEEADGGSSTGFAFSHWSGDPEVEEICKNDLNVTIRCIPLDEGIEEGRCVISGKPSKRRVLFAKAY